jgi:hypothetical protein
MLCGSVWLCPCCGPRIRAARAEEIDAGLSRWIAEGNSVLFLTLTVPHQRAHRLAELMELQKRAWRLTFAGRPWRKDRDRYGVAHHVRVWDTTRGAHGWHPHLHVALCVEGELTDADLESLRLGIALRWGDAVEGAGHPRPHQTFGTHLERARADLGAYLGKVRGEDDIPIAWELARGDLKTSGGLTPHAILARAAATGDLDDFNAWEEWERTVPGSHFCRWSRGARAALGIGERTDEEIIEEEIGGETVATLGRAAWDAITSTRGALVGILEAAEEGGTLAVRRMVRELLLARAPRGKLSSRAPPAA